MKIAFTVYPSAFQAPGGGEVQLLKTKEALEQLGLEIQLFNPWTDKLRDFDILHTFGSVKDSLGLMETARALGVKNVLSTVCWYSWKSAWGTQGSIPSRGLAVSRHAAKVLFPWTSSMRKRMMTISDALLPNSVSEAEQLKRFFCVSEDKIRVIPNGVDPIFETASPDAFVKKFGLSDFVLIVGRIEPRKNQLTSVRALSNQSFPVVIVGDVVPQYQSYYDQCRKEAGKNIHFVGALPHRSELMLSAYAACRTFLLATWLETPGLAALEAGLAGANVVITREGATREYFKDYVLYVNPSDQTQILRSVKESLGKSKSNDLKKHIQQHYLWRHTADKTLLVYKSLLGISQ